MRTWTNPQRLWFYRGLTLLATAILVHLLVVWATPRLIMNRLMSGPAAQAMNMRNQAAFPPAVDATARRVVMPSPDLLYSVCVFDVSAGPVRVRAEPGLPRSTCGWCQKAPTRVTRRCRPAPGWSSAPAPRAFC